MGIFSEDINTQALAIDQTSVTPAWGDTSIIADNNGANVAPGGSLITSSFETTNNGVSSLTDVANSGAASVYNFGKSFNTLIAGVTNLKTSVNNLDAAAGATAQAAQANVSALGRSDVAAGKTSQIIDAIKQHPGEVIGVVVLVVLGIFLLSHHNETAS